MARFSSLFACILVILSSTSLAKAQLKPYYYENICPKALATIQKIVYEAVSVEPRMGASLLRLHFHDCFVNVSLLSPPIIVHTFLGQVSFELTLRIFFYYFA